MHLRGKKNVLQLPPAKGCSIPTPNRSLRFHTLGSSNVDPRANTSCARAHVYIIEKTLGPIKIQIFTAFSLLQKALQPTSLGREREVRSEQVKHVIPSITVILRIANTINRTSPKNMLAEFSRLVATLKRRIPATDRGILFSDPTRLHRC